MVKRYPEWDFDRGLDVQITIRNLNTHLAKLLSYGLRYQLLVGGIVGIVCSRTLLGQSIPAAKRLVSKGKTYQAFVVVIYLIPKAGEALNLCPLRPPRSIELPSG